MKTAIVLTAAFIAATAFTVPAENKMTTPTSVVKNSYAQPFNKIVVENDIDLTLVGSSERYIHFTGNKNDIAQVDWRIQNGTLYLSSKSGSSLKEKVLVTLNVQGLSQIDINGESNVKSLGNINSVSLYVYMNGFGKAAITSSGKIIVVNGDGIKLDVKRKTANVTVLSDES